MAKFVPDVSTRRWVIIAPQRKERPKDNSQQLTNNSQQAVCPFCPGNEKLTPPEVWRVGGEGNWNGTGWKVRVVPNKYPITDLHEVIIHSPDHQKDIEDLSLEQVELIFKVYRQRFQVREKNGKVMIFCNHGWHGGASLVHPHSQLSVLPPQINLDALTREPINNIVWENTFFTVYCPDFSQWPYETWIVPKEKKGIEQGRFKTVVFSEITDEEILDLAEILQKTLRKLLEISTTTASSINVDKDFAYNYYIFHGENWFLRIIPRFIHRAGFELGTGLSVNLVDPGRAAEELRK